MAAVSDHFISLCLLSFFCGISFIFAFLFSYSARDFSILKVHILFFWRAGVNNSRDQGVKHLGGKGDGID